MSAPKFDEVIHAPHRLQICALLAPVESVEFSRVRDTVKVSDSVLSKQVKILQEAGYLVVTKSTRNSRSHTWLALSPVGREALAGHLSELRRLSELAGGIT
jgi:DNA-binding MarR family transcriptional regulator